VKKGTIPATGGKAERGLFERKSENTEEGGGLSIQRGKKEVYRRNKIKNFVLFKKKNRKREKETEKSRNDQERKLSRSLS